MIHQAEQLVIKHLLRYEWMVLLGILLAILASLNATGVTNIDSDFFWALAGVGLAAEAIIEIVIEKRHLKVQSREERNSDFGKLGKKMDEDPGSAVVTVTHGAVGVTMSFITFRNAILRTWGDSK